MKQKLLQSIRHLHSASATLKMCIIFLFVLLLMVEVNENPMPVLRWTDLRDLEILRICQIVIEFVFSKSN